MLILTQTLARGGQGRDTQGHSKQRMAGAREDGWERHVGNGDAKHRLGAIRIWSVVVIPALALVTSSCISLGPKSVPGDRFNYSEALSYSLKQQMLLNIVRLRYGDVPVFVDVTNIVSGFTLGSKVNAGLEPYDVTGSLDLSGELRFEERPTISYEALGGGRFMAALLEPINVATIWSLIESGWNAELLLRSTTNSIGPIANRPPGDDDGHPVDPRFREVVSAIRRLQIDGVIGVRQLRASDSGSARSYLVFRQSAVTPENQRAVQDLRRNLELPAELNEFVIQYDPVDDPGTISFRTRSILQILNEIARDIAAPPDDVARGFVQPNRIDADPVVRIRSGQDRPEDTFCAVRYRDSWFWIDRDDWGSKGSFSFLTLVFQLKAGTREGGGPVLTIPTQ
jgi:hypothetical protein